MYNVCNIELLHTFEVRIWPYFPRRSRVKFGQYAPNGCEVTILSNDWNESCCIPNNTFPIPQGFQKLQEMIFSQLDQKMRAMDRSLLEKIAADIEMMDNDQG